MEVLLKPPMTILQSMIWSNLLFEIDEHPNMAIRQTHILQLCQIHFEI